MVFVLLLSHNEYWSITMHHDAQLSVYEIGSLHIVPDRLKFTIPLPLSLI